MNTTSGLLKRNNKSSRGRTPDGAPNPIDVHVGSRIRMRRQLLGLTQEKLADKLGLTFQQIQKYEHGDNRIGSSRLWDISRVLGIPIGFFFEDMPPEIAQQSPRTFSRLENVPQAENEPEQPETDLMNRAESYELLYDYYRIPNRKLATHLKSIIHESSRNNYNILYSKQNEEKEAPFLMEHELEEAINKIR